MDQKQYNELTTLLTKPHVPVDILLVPVELRDGGFTILPEDRVTDICYYTVTARYKISPDHKPLATVLGKGDAMEIAKQMATRYESSVVN